MAELITVARPYAKAAFQYASENDALAEWSEMLAFAAAVSKDEAMDRFLQNTKVSAEQKAEAFEKVCADKLNQPGKNFVSMLVQNKRLAALSEIAELYEQLKSQKEQSVDVEITSAFPLTDEQANKLAGSLKHKLGRDVNFTTSVDKSLLGGVLVHAGDMVIDASVRGKLAKLAEKLNS